LFTRHDVEVIEQTGPKARRLLGLVLDPFTTDRDPGQDVLDATLILACAAMVDFDRERAVRSAFCWRNMPAILGRPTTYPTRAGGPLPPPRAAEARRLAGDATTPAVKEHLRNLAARFERLAEGVDDAVPGVASG
jgi:hypothetical protein